MSELVKLIQNKIGKNPLKMKIPYSLALVIGLIFDFFAFLTQKKLSISYIRVKKFCASSQFNVDKISSFFQPPFSLKEGVYKTLEHEFLNEINNNL